MTRLETADANAERTAYYVSMLTAAPMNSDDAAGITAALTAARMAQLNLSAVIDALRDEHVRMTGDASYCARHDLYDCPYIAADADAARVG